MISASNYAGLFFFVINVKIFSKTTSKLCHKPGRSELMVLFILSYSFRVQVRRTDKINTEAAFHSIEEYMYWVDLYYNKLERVKPVEQRRVFLATDDSNLLPEAKEK